MNNIFSSKLVSIGIPTYNRPDGLKNILTIVTSQSYTNLEIIISDNASTDSRVTDIIAEFLQVDNRIKYFRQEQNIGILRNFHFVLEKSTGEYFTWISDDDWRAPEFIERMVSLLESNQSCDLAFCDYHEVYENGNFALGYPFSHFNFFKAYQSKYKLIRTISYYWENQKNGKSILFHSIFRKTAFTAIDFKNLSLGYNYLGVDVQLVFKLLQMSPVILTQDPLCCITCQNFKYYQSTVKKGRYTKSISTIIQIISSHYFELKLYLRNASSGIERFLILILVFPKLFWEFSELIFNKFFKKLISLLGLTSNNIDRFPLNDQRDTEKKIILSNVTLVSVDTQNPEEALDALLYSSRHIEFGNILLLSHFTPYCKGTTVNFVQIPKISGIYEWCYFIIYELHKYIETDYVMLIHADGFVVNPSSWRPDFLHYDYIGAPWPMPLEQISYRDINNNIIRVGNSVSIRSKKILVMPSQLNIPWVERNDFFHEDGFLCCINRHILEENDIKFAPIEVAKYFAHEQMIPEIRQIQPFAFHKWEGTNFKYPNFFLRKYANTFSIRFLKYLLRSILNKLKVKGF